jgi:cell division protein FtsZ
VTIAIVTTPFSFEMGRRQRNASVGLANLRPHTDTLIAIPNDRLLYVAPRNLPMEVAFRLADDVLRQAVQGITELITEPGLINIDFAHVRRLMQLGGGALMSIGQGQGNSKARQAIEQALHHPLLESVSLDNAAGVIANFTGGKDLTLMEVSEVLIDLQVQIGPQAEIVLGVTHDESMRDRAQVILVVTGLGAPALEDVLPGASALVQGTAPSETQHPTPSVLLRPTASAAGQAVPVPQPPGSRLDRALQSLEPPVVPVNPPQPVSSRPAAAYPSQDQEPSFEEQAPMTVINPPRHPDPHDLDLPAFLRKRIRLSG